jgi:hypothetical protein
MQLHPGFDTPRRILIVVTNLLLEAVPTSTPQPLEETSNPLLLKMYLWVLLKHAFY